MQRGTEGGGDEGEPKTKKSGPGAGGKAVLRPCLAVGMSRLKMEKSIIWERL